METGDVIWYDDGVVEPRLVRLVGVRRQANGWRVYFRLAGVNVHRVLPLETRAIRELVRDAITETSTDPLSVLSRQDHERDNGDPSGVMSTGARDEEQTSWLTGHHHAT